MTLADLKSGESATIVKVGGYGAFRRRILEMGFIRGEKVSVVLNAPLNDPIAYKIMDYEVSLRRSEASLIEIITEEECNQYDDMGGSHDAAQESTPALSKIESATKLISIALVGNPNCGKTSMFNRASGASEHVGNYSGVTVDAKRGTFKYKDYTFEIYDLPGTYALSAYSPEEVYVRKHIVEKNPDVVVNVVASSNLERNLYLTTELINMDCSTVVALNMYDELVAQKAKLDHKMLGELLGVPMVPTDSRRGNGFDDLFDTIIEVFEGRNTTVRHIHINHGVEIEKSIKALQQVIRKEEDLRSIFSSRYLAIKILENDDAINTLLSKSENYKNIIALRDRELHRISELIGDDIENIIISYNYGFIDGALKETYLPGKEEESQARRTRIYDNIATHKIWGFPIFLLLMWLTFTATFTLGSYPMEWIEAGVESLSSLLQRIMTDGVLKDLVIDGIIAGVGGVIVFLPNIVILYLFISLMEDSGYMARAAFIMDKLMHKMGLHGKSFIPMIMGLGCNVPAIMATRTIESRTSRLVTILVNPFMSCSARLPVYLLLVGAFFDSYRGTILFLIYLFGIMVAVITAKLLRATVLKGENTPFVMELPQYRIPTMRSVWIHMWDKSSQYLKKIGSVILVASIAIWFLNYYPHNENIEENAQQENSYLGRIGKCIDPIMSPLDFTWQANVSLITGMAAKEVIVSTLGVLYTNNSDVESDDKNLRKALKADSDITGKPNFTPLTALAYIAFVLLCFPCLATVAAVASECGSWKWAAFMVVYNTTLAWVVAWLIVNIGKLII